MLFSHSHLVISSFERVESNVCVVVFNLPDLEQSDNANREKQLKLHFNVDFRTVTYFDKETQGYQYVGHDWNAIQDMFTNYLSHDRAWPQYHFAMRELAHGHAFPLAESERTFKWHARYQMHVDALVANSISNTYK
jgi:hypothetical protein